MNILFIVLFVCSPILGVTFAAILVGLPLPGVRVPSNISRPTRQELAAIRPSKPETARRHTAGAQSSQRRNPAPGISGATWRAVLGLPLNEHRRSVAHQAYRTLARANHPDRSGSHEAMQMVNDAWKMAKKELVLR